MPPRDYSKGLIYKIACKNPSITDCYVGSTIDLIRRRAEHKGACNHESNSKHNLPVYQYIRENGGWDNWVVVPIEQYPSETKAQLEIRERHWLEQLDATLNSYKPASYALAGSKEEYNRQHYADNREELCEKSRQYYYDNRERMKEQRMEWLSKNREALYERKRQKITCECGCKVGRNDIAKHRRTAKHQKLLAENNQATQ